MTDTDPLVRARDVSRTFGGVPVVSSVSLAVRPGVTAMIGPNGSGKSTLLRLLAGAIEPTDGTVEYLGSDAERPIGYLPQQSSFRAPFTARETLAFYARLVGSTPDDPLDRVGLTDAGDRRVDALSGGMRRLLGIAQATIGDPPVVILDEPASGLDPTMRERAFDVTASIADADRAVVVTSHDLDLVERHADRVVLLDRGSVVVSGTLDRIYSETNTTDLTSLYENVIGTHREAVHVTGVTR